MRPVTRRARFAAPFLAAALAASPSAAQDAAPAGLLADFKSSPALGVRLAPSFSWIVAPCASGAEDGTQTAYEIVVSSLATGSAAVVWDSGRVLSGDSTYAAYAGPALSPSTRYSWTVSTWTAACASPPSQPALFVTGPFGGFDASAQFVSMPTPGAIFGYLRREVQLPPNVTSAVIAVAAYCDDRLLSGYKLFVADVLVSVGPGRGEAPVFGGDGAFRSLPVTTIDVTSALAPGGVTAVLALQAMHNSPPRAILQLALTMADGSTAVVATDGSWRAFDGDVHRRPGPPLSGGSAGTDYVEHIDARAEPIGWTAQGFVEGAGWAAAVGAAPSAVELQNLYPRMEPQLDVDEEVQVVATWPIPSPPIPAGVSCGVVPNHGVFFGACPNGSTILGLTFASFGDPTGVCPGPFAKGSCESESSFATVEAACVGQTYCSVLASKYTFNGTDPCPNGVNKTLAVSLVCPADPGPPPPLPNRTSFIHDFGKELQGGLRLDVVDGIAGTTVDISLGEHVSNGTSVDYFWGWAFRWTLRDGAQQLEMHKYAEFRYAQLTWSGPSPTYIASAWRVAYPWHDGDSAFVSSNATLDAVYELCRYTVFSAALDTYTDSNTRERTPYEADGLIAASGRIAVQRDYLFPRHSHAYVLQNPTWPVEWKMLTPYLAWQDYQATGQPDLALAFEGRLHNSTMISYLEISTGLLRTDNMTAEGSHIVDWMPDGNEEDETVKRGEFTASPHMSVTNGMAARGLEILSELMAAGGRAQSAAQYASEGAALVSAIDAHMWGGPVNGTFCDGVCSEVAGASLLFTNAYFLAFGLTLKLHGQAAVEKAWAQVAAWGIEGIGDYGAFWWQLAIAGSYYADLYDTPDDGTKLLDGLTKCDFYSWCSGLRDDNLTMTRESWHDGTFSHGWGTSPLLGITFGVLGVHQTSPAFASFVVTPKLGSLAFANGTVPTLRGFISVSASPGAVDVAVPCNSRATLCAPRSARDEGGFAAATHALLLGGEEVQGAVVRGGHLCMPREVGCGAAGRAWELRVRARY